MEPLNAFDMDILIQVENIEAYLPESLYTYKDYITVKTKLLEVEIRGTDQFQGIIIIILMNYYIIFFFIYINIILLIF